MRQRRWIELFSDYHCEIRYHPGKENMVDDALSKKERVKPKRVRAMNMILQSSIKDRILMAQKEAVDEFVGLQKGLDEMIEQRSDGIAMDFVTKLPRTSSGHDTIPANQSPYMVMERCGTLWEERETSTSIFVGPFEIIKKVGSVAYRLELPEELNGVHDTFHVSNLKKCLADPTLQVPLDEIRVDDKLNFEEELVEILKREFKKLNRSRIFIVKVRWNSKHGPEFMWERED
ncbi:hypothetical protein Tco_0636300 [Tanacetum coccineum]